VKHVRESNSPHMCFQNGVKNATKQKIALTSLGFKYSMLVVLQTLWILKSYSMMVDGLIGMARLYVTLICLLDPFEDRDRPYRFLGLVDFSVSEHAHFHV